MSDSLLPYYNRELDALRRLANDFAESNPKIAGRLRLTPGSVDDPHVERLLEGAAFLSARAQRRLDDEFPEISDALLNVLHPHYLAPIPSACIVQFGCKPDAQGATVVPVGTLIDTDPVRGEACRFQTAFATTLWPMQIESVRLTGIPLAAPAIPLRQRARSSLRIVLRLTDPDTSFDELGVDQLRFCLRAPAEQSLLLYELLCGHTVNVAVADGPNDDRPTILPAASIQPVGFAPEEALYPWSARSFSGFRLLTEYFALPEKFLFIDIKDLEARTLIHKGDRLEIFIYFDEAHPELERQLRSDSLALDCTPMVNLFDRKCEPIRMDGQRTEYQIVPDNRRPHSLEVWHVKQVREMRDDGSTRPWRSFYRQPAEPIPGEVAGYYLTMRQNDGGRGSGSDVFLAPFDPQLPTEQPAGTILSVDAICSNGDLPGRLPFGGGQPRLRLTEAISSVTNVTCLTPPTPSWRKPLREQRSWRLISHLSLGHLSIVGGPEATENLRELLRLYDVQDRSETRAIISGLVDVRSRDATARVPGARLGSFCRGLDVTLVFEPSAWRSSGLMLLASVLERFLSLHATVNAFVRTTAVLSGQPGSVATFPPRAGVRILL